MATTLLAYAAPALAATGAGDVDPLASVLTRTDVPPALGIPKDGRFDYDASSARRSPIGLCQVGPGGTELSSAGGPGVEAMVVLEGSGYREVDERVYIYPTDPAAARAWTSVQRRARRCDTVSVTPIDDNGTTGGGSLVSTYTTGRVGRAHSAVWISESVRADAPGTEAAGSVTTTYTVLRRTGRVIVATWLYLNGDYRTTRAQRSAVDRLSGVLTNRWR